MNYDIDGQEMSKEAVLDLASWLSDGRGAIFWQWVASRTSNSIQNIDGEPDVNIHPTFRQIRIERILGQHAKVREILAFKNRVNNLLKP